MSEAHGLGARWRELRRHPAVQAAAVYIGASWALIQVADIFVADQRIVRGLGILLAVGFVAVVAISWWLAQREQAEVVVAADTPETSQPPRRRRRRLAYGAAALLLVVGGVFWWIRPNILGAVEPDAQVIAVLPFNASGPGVELLGEGMVDLLSTNLDAVGAIRTIDSRTVLHRWRQRTLDGGLDLDGSLAVGRDVDAGSVLLGSVVSVGPEVRLSAELYSVRGTELATAQVQGPADSVLALVDQLGVSLLREIWLAHEPLPNLRVSGITTSDVDAIRAYLRGQQHYRRSEWDSAFAAFQQAIEADSTFALAHYRLGQVYGWSAKLGGFGSEGARRHGELALRYSDHLPDRERTIVVANTMYEDGQVAAHDTMQRYVDRFPDDPEGWYLLADIRYHAQPIMGFDLEDIIGPFERALELDPSLAPARVHPLELSLAYGDSARYNRHLSELRSTAPSDYTQAFDRAATVWVDADSSTARFLAVSRTTTLQDELVLALYHTPPLHPEALLSMMDVIQPEVERGTDSWKQIVSARALMLASLGRLAEARPLFDTLWAVAGPRESIAHMGLLPVLAGLADPSYAPGPVEQLFVVPAEPESRQLALQRSMFYELARGGTAEARRLGAEALAADSMPRFDFLPSLIEGGFGWADIIDGDTVGGLERLRSALYEAGYARGPVLAWSQQLRIALTATLAAYPPTRAEGIRRLRYAHALFTDMIYFGLNYLALGQALEAEGDVAGAVAAYSRFIELWKDADPELQPRVETARRALQRLTAESG